MQAMRDAVRFGPISAIDLVGTIVIAGGLAQYNQWSVPKTVLGALVLGEVIHVMIGQKTPVTEAIVPA